MEYAHCYAHHKYVWIFRIKCIIRAETLSINEAIRQGYNNSIENQYNYAHAQLKYERNACKEEGDANAEHKALGDGLELERGSY